MEPKFSWFTLIAIFEYVQVFQAMCVCVHACAREWECVRTSLCACVAMLREPSAAAEPALSAGTPTWLPWAYVTHSHNIGCVRRLHTNQSTHCRRLCICVWVC